MEITMVSKRYHLLGASLIALIIICFASTHTFAENQEIKAPPENSPYYTLIESLKLIKAEAYDDWISKWCSKNELCFNETSIASLKKYNLPAINRLAPDCLKGEAKDYIIVTRIDGDPEKDAKLQIFIQCKAEGMPKPFRLINESGWKIYGL
jgi:hypothetical protein